MTERPIIFSGPMVRAILDGRKTQTRRIVTPSVPSDRGLELIPHDPALVPGGHFCARLLPIVSGPDAGGDPGLGWRTCRHGQPGDKLWVRESWCVASGWYPAQNYTWRADYSESDWKEHVRDCTYEKGGPKLFNCMACGFTGWKSGRFMPRAASRLTLEVTDVRVERLQDISESDACNEIGGNPLLRWCYRPKFQELWDSINGKRAPWASNPWIWAVSFIRRDYHRGGHLGETEKAEDRK
jgi:hypothetical protein